MRDYRSPRYKAWRLSVYKRDKFRCVCCGKTFKKLNAHHLDGWNWAISQRFSVGNGVTLCRRHHNKFHKIYGRGNNTREQFATFILRFFKRNLEDIL